MPKEKQLKCPDCSQVCQLGRYNNHQSYSMLSVEWTNGYFLIGIHYTNPEFGHCASFKAGRKKLLKLIFDNDYSSEMMQHFWTIT